MTFCGEGLLKDYGGAQDREIFKTQDLYTQ